MTFNKSTTLSANLLPLTNIPLKPPSISTRSSTRRPSLGVIPQVHTPYNSNGNTTRRKNSTNNSKYTWHVFHNCHNINQNVCNNSYCLRLGYRTSYQKKPCSNYYYKPFTVLFMCGCILYTILLHANVSWTT